MDPGRNHPRLSEAKKGKYRYWRILEFTWIIDASESAPQIYDYLEENISQNDKLFVCKLAGDAALADGFSEEGTDWLERILETFASSAPTAVFSVIDLRSMMHA